MKPVLSFASVLLIIRPLSPLAPVTDLDVGDLGDNFLSDRLTGLFLAVIANVTSAVDSEQCCCHWRLMLLSAPVSQDWR